MKEATLYTSDLSFPPLSLACEHQAVKQRGKDRSSACPGLFQFRSVPDLTHCAVTLSWYIKTWMDGARLGFSSGSSHIQKSCGVLDLFKQERVDKGIETDGSNLSGVSAKCAWDDLSRPPEDDEDSRSICIGTQPRRLSGKGKRSCAVALPWPFGH